MRRVYCGRTPLGAWRSLTSRAMAKAPTTAPVSSRASAKLARKAASDDRRKVDLRLTPKGSRVLDGRFTVIPYSVGTLKGRDAGARYLREFIEDAKASGFVARSIERNGIRGVAVAPAIKP